MSWKALDWKFFLTISVAIAGVVVPVLWQTDFSSKAIELRLTSLSSLEPASKIRNLEMFLDGHKLDAPYASTMELVNSGSKAVMSKDFDTPIEIYLNEGARFAGAEVVATSPPGLPVQLSVTDQTIVIAKHLSNPGDSMTLNVVTSGTRPDFSVRARIAGISQIKTVNQTLPKSKLAKHTGDAIAAICVLMLLGVCALFLLILMTRSALGVPKRVSIIVSSCTYVGATFLSGRVLASIDVTSWPVTIGIGTTLGITSWSLGKYLVRKWDQKTALRCSTPPASMPLRYWQGQKNE